MRTTEQIDLEIDHIEYAKNMLEERLASVKAERDDLREDTFIKDQHTKLLAEFFYKTDKLTPIQINDVKNFCKVLEENKWLKYKYHTHSFKLTPSYTNDQKKFLQSGWSEKASICLIANTLRQFMQSRKLTPKLFWNVELKYIDSKNKNRNDMELDLVAQVEERFYLFEVKSGNNLGIKKWVDRADLFEGKDRNNRFITCTSEKINYHIFQPYRLFALQEIEELFTKMLEKDFPVPCETKKS